MTPIPAINPIAAASVSASAAPSLDQQTLVALQIQLDAYTSGANGLNPLAKAAYQALQSAITSGDVAQAQADLLTLQRVSQSADPAPSASSPPVDGNGGPDGSSLNVKA